ncbi:MAG TPA: hypothetical protein VK817_25990 [Trebonia sp.]|jgi:hypothetical protein|nr:hypothetical protein [Trebonia sp.]
MTAEFLWINIPLMALAFVLWVGIPLWLVLRHPDEKPRETRAVPAYLSRRVVRETGATAPPSAEEVRELVLSGNR